MLKKMLLAVFLLFLFASPVRAAIGTSPNVSQPPQIIVGFKAGQSPDELQNTIIERTKETGTFWGSIKVWTLEVTGIVPGITYYQKRLNQIEDIKKQVNVSSIKKSYKIKSLSVYTVGLKNPEDKNKAIELFRTLTGVEYAEPDNLRVIQKIQSETNPTKIKQVVVWYKKDQAPQKIADAIDTRERIASQPIFGKLRISSQNAVVDSTQKEIIKQNIKVEQDVGFVSSKSFLPFQSKKETTFDNAVVVKLDENSSPQDAAKAYKTLPNVEYAEPDNIRIPTNTPNDPEFSKLWGMKQIKAETAWDTTQGSDSITVAVVDTGVDYNHPDLAGRVIKGTNTVGGSDVMDDVGHGTHVSGTIGAIGNNGIGVVGINWKVKILAVKVLGPNGGPESAVSAGIIYAAQNGAKVINLSLGGCSAQDGPRPDNCPHVPENKVVSRTEKDAIDTAITAGATVVIAAGNSADDATYYAPGNYNISPGAVGKVLVVGATAPGDRQTSYSNYGSLVDIAAPGGDQPCATDCIYSTFPNAGYKMEGGTSMAAPHVSGGAALLLSVNTGLSPSQIRDAIIKTADPIQGNIGPRLNLAKLVSSAAGLSPTPTGTQPSGNPSITPPAGSPTPPSGTSPTPGGGSPSITAPNPSPTGSGVLVTVKIPGLGSGVGDNPKSVYDVRPLRIDFIKNDGTVLASTTGDVSFKDGGYSGIIALPDITPGTYQIKVSLDNSLTKLAPGFYTLSKDKNITLPAVTLTTGDLNQDGVLDIVDYNSLISCIGGGGCEKSVADLNDDGKVDENDLNIFLRQLSTREGD